MKKKNVPLVTVIITNFNKSRYLSKAIFSCYKQKYQKIEIVFFDDKSTDSSLLKLKSLKKDNKIKLKVLTNKKKY